MIYRYNVPFWFIPEGGTVLDPTLITHVLLYGQPKDIINLGANMRAVHSFFGKA